MAQKNPFSKANVGREAMDVKKSNPMTATPSHQDNIPFMDKFRDEPVARRQQKVINLNYNEWLMKGK